MTPDLSTWLLEQIAEDERQLGAHHDEDCGIFTGECACPSKQRWLAECEAKRRRIEHLVDRLESWRIGLHDSHDREDAIDDLEMMFKLEALPYSDRPGYREEWKP